MGKGGWVDFLFGCGEKGLALAIKSRLLEQKNSSLILYGKKPPEACAGYYSKGRLSFWGRDEIIAAVFFCAKALHSVPFLKLSFKSGSKT